MNLPEQLGVCMYTPAANSGHARYTHQLLSAMATVGRDQGVSVSLVTSQDLRPEFRASTYPIHPILPPLQDRSTFGTSLTWAGSRGLHYLGRERQFLAWLHSQPGLRAVHFQEYAPWLAPRHFRALKKRYLLFYTVHNIHPHSYPGILPKGLVNSWNRRSWRLCDTLFVHSRGLRSALSDFLGPNHPPIRVTPHGVWDVTPDPAPALRSDADLRRKQLLFFGTIRPSKGLHVLLRAMTLLPEYRLVVAGEVELPAYGDHIRSLVARLPSHQVRLIDRFIDSAEVPGLFQESSLVVLPYTKFAAQSGVLHDALAYGVPVVVADVGALGESVREWGTGLVAPPEDEVALAAAIRDLTTPSRFRAAATATARVREERSWQRSAIVTIAAYREAWQSAGSAAR